MKEGCVVQSVSLNPIVSRNSRTAERYIEEGEIKDVQ